MNPRDIHPDVEAFLILEQPRQRLSHWASALAPLDAGVAPPLSSVIAYYDPSTDQALLGLYYDEDALGPERLSFVVEIALLAEIGMIQPAELHDAERQRFVSQRIARCTIQVSDQRNVVNALIELVRRVREHKAPPKVVVAALPLRPTPPPPPKSSARASVKPRGTTEDPVLLVQPKSTRDDLKTLPKSTRNDLATCNDLTSEIEPVYKLHEEPTRISAHVIPRKPTQRRGSPGPSQLADPPTDRPVVDPPTERTPRARSPSKLGTEPYLPATTTPQVPGIIYARYLRSGRWVPIRIGALSLKGAALMAGALPRIQDQVDVALSFGGHRALVRGAVGKVSTSEEVMLSGASTFSVSFDLDDASRRQLTALLTAARAANVTIKPPPPRSTRRFPVEWPVCLGTSRGAVRADALDVSRDGMFVRPQHALTVGSLLNFSSVLDDGASPISGRARVVRQIHEAEARACGLAIGFGLQLMELAELDRTRWMGFLDRIEQRAAKRILIGAAPARLAELQSVLSAVGYAVIGGTDPGALVQLASGQQRAVDAALLDAEWLTPTVSASWVESLFTDRNVPCVTLRGDGRRARAAIDKLLGL